MAEYKKIFVYFCPFFVIICAKGAGSMQHEIIRFGAVEDIAASNSKGLFHYPAHWHDEAEFTLALKDGCVLRIGEEEYTLMQGDILLVWPREMHETVSIPEDGTLFIQFSASLLESNRDLAVAIRMLFPLHHLQQARYPDLTARLAQDMRDMMQIYQSDDFLRESRCKLLIYQMLMRLAEYGHEAKIRQFEAPGFSQATFERMRQACAYIDAHHTDNLRQSEVAAAVGMSTWYFSRLFRQYIQSSFPEYLCRVRVHTARHLLTASDLTITECAYQAGFQSSTVFNKAFLALTGTSPREYRRGHVNAYAENSGS